MSKLHQYPLAVVPKSWLPTTVGNNKGVQLMHYVGSEKVTPLAGVGFAQLCARQVSVLATHEKGALWLKSKRHRIKAVINVFCIISGLINNTLVILWNR